MTPNLALRWLTIPGMLLLLTDGFLVLAIVRGVGEPSAAGSSHPVVRWLRTGIMSVLVIIASAWWLSSVRLLNSWGFLGLHAIAAALLAAFGPRRRGPGGRRPGLGVVLFLGGDRRPRTRTGGCGRVLLPLAGWILVFLLVYTLAVAVGVFSMNWDSQTYRLSRVGYWLQERRIDLNFANESRLFFMPINAELIMLWLTCFFPIGYPLVNLGQFVGGCLTLLSAWEMARLAGLSREARLLVVFLVIGIPVVCLEFATSQSDLFTGGLLNAGLVFSWRSLRNASRREVILAGIAIGLALGAKSTVIYWVPGLALWMVLLLLKHRPRFRRGLAVFAISGGVAVLVGGWKYADNEVRYGNPFAPSADIARVHHQGSGGAAASLKFVAWSHLWQLAQPDSNPAFLASCLRPISQRLAGHIAASAPDRELSDAYRTVRDANAGDAGFEDIVSFGLLVPILAVFGVIGDGLRSRRSPGTGAPLRLAMAAAVAAFLVVFLHEMNLNPWNYRYFVMFAPFAAILAAAAWPVRRWGQAALVTAFLVMMLQAYTVLDLQNRNPLGGWRSWFDRPAGTALFETLAGQLSGSDPTVDRVAVAVGGNSWLSPYFRLPGHRQVSFVSLDTLASRYPSASDFLARAGFAALLAEPGVFAAGPGPGVAAGTNGLTGPFAKVLYTRIR